MLQNSVKHKDQFLEHSMKRGSCDTNNPDGFSGLEQSHLLLQHTKRC